MRIGLALLLGLPVVLLMQADVVQAQNYPWCAEYAMQGTSNCGFATLAQCHAALSGNGGYCVENPMFRPGIGYLPASPRPRR